MNFLCRICLETGAKFIHLYNHFENGKALSDMLTDCATIKFKEDDGFPCHVCSDCMKQLTSCWNFRLLIIESDRKLRSTKEFKSRDASIYNIVVIKEEPCINELSLRESQNECNNDLNDIIQYPHKVSLINKNLVVVASNSHNSARRNDSDLIQNNFYNENSYIEIESDLCQKKNLDKYQENVVQTSNNPVSKKVISDPKIFQRGILNNLSRKSKDIFQNQHCENLDSTKENLSIINFPLIQKEGGSELSSDAMLEEELIESKCQINPNQFLYDSISKSQTFTNEDTKFINDSKVPQTVFCKECNKSISYRYYYKVHAPSHKGNRPFKCDICDKSFVTNYLLTLHKSVHTEVRPHMCDLCGKSFKTYRIMRFHRSLHIKGRCHICKLCNAGFKLKASLEAHIAIHNNEKKYICEICGKSFTTGSNLSVHKSSHVTEKTLPCTSCDKLFPSKKKLRVHLRSHSDERPHACDYCGKSFKTSGEKKRHALMHTGEKPYSCKICGKNFSDCSSIGRHMLIHTGETPYSCSKCSMKFKYKQQFDKHLKKHK